MSKLNLPVHLSLFYLLAVFVSLGVDFIGGRYIHPWLFNRQLEILQQQGSEPSQKVWGDSPTVSGQIWN